MQGTLDSGTTFDSSRQEGRGPLPFVLGQNRVIQGNWLLIFFFVVAAVFDLLKIGMNLVLVKEFIWLHGWCYNLCF